MLLKQLLLCLFGWGCGNLLDYLVLLLLKIVFLYNGKFYNVERVIVVGKLTTTKQHLWYLLDGDVREGTATLLLEGCAAYQQRLSLLHLLCYGS